MFRTQVQTACKGRYPRLHLVQHLIDEFHRYALGINNLEQHYGTAFVTVRAVGLEVRNQLVKLNRQIGRASCRDRVLW